MDALRGHRRRQGLPPFDVEQARDVVPVRSGRTGDVPADVLALVEDARGIRDVVDLIQRPVPARELPLLEDTRIPVSVR